MPEAAIEEITQQFGKMQEAITALRKANDENLEKRDALTEEKMGRISSDVEAMRGDLAKMQRAPLGMDDSGESAEQRKYRSAFAQYMRTGDTAEIRVAAVELQKRTGQSSVASDGGYAIPTIIEAMVGEFVRENAPFRSLARVITTGTPQYSKLYSNGGAVAGWVGEASATPVTSSPDLREEGLTTGRLYAKPDFTITVTEDAFFNFEQWFVTEVGETFVEKETEAFTGGDGVNKPLGILSKGATATVDNDRTRTGGLWQKVVADGAAVTADHLVELHGKLLPRFRRNAAWLMNKDTFTEMLKIKDGDGRYMVERSLSASIPETLLGYRIEDVDFMPDIAVGEFPIALGDWSQAYTIVDIANSFMTIRQHKEDSPEYIQMYTRKRVGSMFGHHKAAKLLEVAA